MNEDTDDSKRLDAAMQSQVQHDAQDAVRIARGLANRRDRLPVLLLGAVGKIEPRNVHPGENHRLDHLAAAAAGTQRTNDLRPHVHRVPYVCGGGTGWPWPSAAPRPIGSSFTWGIL